MLREGTTMLEQVNNFMGRILIAGEEKSWDFGFLESITKQLASGRTLSANQERVFQQIKGRWSDEALKARGAWSKDWDDEKEQKFCIALNYYDRTGYYGNITGKYLKYENGKNVRSGGTPTMGEYNKLVENKYAAGVIRNFLSEPSFVVGSTACFRAASGTRRFANKPVVILKYGGFEKVRSHGKGAKPVQVLPIGSAEPIWTEERHLKKAKKRK
tara:strand:+ start:127 stop:771 length:645 start_codon:yes stop_codon:yes gene_type:complete